MGVGGHRPLGTGHCCIKDRGWGACPLGTGHSLMRHGAKNVRHGVKDGGACPINLF